jgi:uncharacterized protein (TIGR03118 family)
VKKLHSYVLMVVCASALTLPGCGGSSSPSSSSAAASSSSSPSSSTSTAATAYTNTALVANTAAGTVDVLPANTVAQGDSNSFTFPQTENTSLDPNLSIGWGVAFAPASAVWVNDYVTNLSSLYDGNGNVISPSVQPAVAIPPNASGGAAGPTGIVANINTINCPTVAATTCGFGTGFPAGAGSAQFIFDGTGGTISAWAAGDTAITEFDGSASGDNFTGLAIYTQSSGSTFILAADFHHGTVDVFDSNFLPNTTAFSGGFVDPNLPAGYAPFGIQTLGNMIYVSYAEQPSTSQASTPGIPVLGEGLGLVDLFDGTGTLMQELIPTGGPLNAPWGMAMAPQGFGSYGGDLLIGNFGDGRINVFDPTTGEMLGTLMDASTGAPVHIPGLWGIAFGNGAFSQSPTTLYYAAGPDMISQGLYGSLSPAAASSSSSSSSSAPPSVY